MSGPIVPRAEWFDYEPYRSPEEPVARAVAPPRAPPPPRPPAGALVDVITASYLLGRSPMDAYTWAMAGKLGPVHRVAGRIRLGRVAVLAARNRGAVP